MSISAAAAVGSLGLGIVGGVMNAKGVNQSYQAKASNAAYQAQVAQNNAAIARTNATLDREAGDIAATNQGFRTRAVIGATLAGQAASGVDVNTGSFVHARAGEAEAGMLDALTIRSDAAKKAWAQETQASNFEAEAGLQRMESQQALKAGPTAATGSLLSSASSVGSGFAKFLQTT